MLRGDSIRSALQPPYSAPYHILQRIGKVFVLRIDTKKFRVSVNRKKTAFFLDIDSLSSGAFLTTPSSSRRERPTITTHLEQRIHFTNFFPVQPIFLPRGDVAPPLIYHL
ncbi:hypothetical protein TNCV_3577751 [Trichonephila clavipes]|uniref:Uncharacterized protein n=1 Tax=Trichonephila clavipes TaxID=2585209 RepID=A0A8X6RD90_TRICX|nr:hypothetical protein TNCV_3577751 [Trichonephila clavipes]